MSWILSLCPSQVPESFGGDVRARQRLGAHLIGPKRDSLSETRDRGVLSDDVGGVTQERFRTLTPTRQWEVIDLLHHTAQDAKLAQQDREIALERERQLLAVAKKRPKPHRSI